MIILALIFSEINEKILFPLKIYELRIAKLEFVLNGCTPSFKTKRGF